jgi:hypothetical protein
MDYSPPEVDIDLWFFAAAEKLEEFSLVRDEILAEQRGRSHLYRRKHKGRTMSESGIKRSLEVFNAPTHSGEGWGFRNNARIGERRERISQVLIDKKNASKPISEFISSKCQLAMNDGESSGEALFYPISDELLAALIVSGGPRAAMDTVRKYHKWHQEKWCFTPAGIDCDWLMQYHFEMPGLYLCEHVGHGWTRGVSTGPWSHRKGFVVRLPTASLICNEKEAIELVGHVFDGIAKSIKKNYNGVFKRYTKAGRYDTWIRDNQERKEVEGYLNQANYRIALGGEGWDSPHFDHYGNLEDDENLENHTILGLLIRKYPSLVAVIEKYGWTSVGGKFGVSKKGEEIIIEDEDDEEELLCCSPCYWHLSRSTTP